MGADWSKIKTEYITSDISLRKLAEKHGIRYATVQERSKKESWIGLRDQHRAKTVSKVLAADSRRKADRMVRILKATDKLLDKVERAIDELDIQICKQTEKEKIIEYNNSERPDKPTRETIKETETVAEVTSIIDRLGLKQIASALKDIEEAQMLRSELDEQEQKARISALQKKAEAEDTHTDVVITFGSEEQRKWAE